MSDYLDRLEAQLSRLTEQGTNQRRAPVRRPVTGYTGTSGRSGGTRPPRRSSEIFAVLAAASVVAAIVAIVLGNVRSPNPHRTSATATRPAAAKKPHTSPKSTAPAPTPAGALAAQVPPHFAPGAFTAIGELTWWLLGPGSCPAGFTGPCGAMLRTSDGGRNFTGVPTPKAPFAPSAAQGAGYSHLAFADPQNGYAYAPALYATHNGGSTWQQIDVGGSVTNLAISGGQVYAVVSPPGGASGKLMRSPVGHDTWVALSGAGAVSGGLWVQGSYVITQSAAGTGVGGNVMVSRDGGNTFTASLAPSPGFPCQFSAPEPPVVWAECPTGTESGVWRSTDAGAHFTVAAGTGTSLPLPNSAPFAAASSSIAVVGAKPMLYRSDSSGSLWSQTGPSGIAQWAYLGFTDATHGAALGYAGSISPGNERLYYTTDGGQSYHVVPLP